MYYKICLKSAYRHKYNFETGATSVALFLCIIKSMRSEKVKFVFNQTKSYAGVRYQSGDVVEMPEPDAKQFKAEGLGSLYKGKKKEKA